MKKKKKSAATGCLFWVCLLIVLGCAALVARGPIEATLAKLFGGKTQTVEVRPLAPNDKGDNPPAVNPPAGARPVSDGTRAANPPVTRDAPPDSAPAEKQTVRKTRLFFAGVETNGTIVLRGVIRAVPASDSPLRDTIQTLLSGPNSQEVNLGLLTMIPSGSKLRGVTVRGDTAVLDFSESFRFNTLGAEGLNAELKQVVYASTEFPTVKKVQILIEGKKVAYLGPEGIRIDAPLDRQSFKD